MQIHENKIVVIFPHLLEALAPVGGFVRTMAEVGKQTEGQDLVHGNVLDHKNSQGLPRGIPRPGSQVGGRRRLVLGRRLGGLNNQRERERGAVPLAAFRPDFSTHQRDQAFANGEPETGATVLAR